MEVTQTRADGLSRELRVVVPAATLGEKLHAYLDDMRQKVKLKGFRPGKVPMAHLRKMYGRSAMLEVVNDVMQQSVKDAVNTRDEKPALQPDVDVDQDAMKDVLEGRTDLAFAIKYEVLPTIEVSGLDMVSVERPVYTVPDEELEAELAKLAERYQDFAPVDDRAAGDGDRLKIDFLGKVDGVPFEGGAADGLDIVIGQNRFIPGFEEQLNGLRAGDETVVSVTFPADYAAPDLAGKAATFDVNVHEVSAPTTTALDDAFAEKLGLGSLDKLREAMKGQMQSSYDRAIRNRTKRALLDALDERFKFELPQKLVQTEFAAIWRQVEAEMVERGTTFDATIADDADGSEAATRAEYQRIAERRVRLGLLLSEIGTEAKVEVTDEEVQRALSERMRQFPGKERELVDYYRKNPQALASLRAPIFEDKVVDHMLTLVRVTDVPVTKEDLLRDAEEDADDHDHQDHGHDHHDHEHAGHDHHDHDHGAHDHAGHDHGGHDHGAHDHGHDHGGHTHDHGHVHGDEPSHAHNSDTHHDGGAGNDDQRATDHGHAEDHPDAAAEAAHDAPTRTDGDDQQRQGSTS